MFVLITIVILTILISAHCSLCEAVLYSTRLGMLESEKAEGRRSYKAAKFIEMRKQISIPLSSILILNTAAHTAGSLIAGRYAHEMLEASWFPLFSTMFMLVILFFGEIIPKTLGAVHWRYFWHLIVMPLNVMKYMLYPLIFISHKISESMTHESMAPMMTEKDILGAIRLGVKDGEISPMESKMLHNIIRLEEKEIRQVMTPRTVMFTLDENMTMEDAFDKAIEEGFSRIPLYRKEKENIVGYVMLHDLTSAKLLSRQNLRLSSLSKPIPIVPEKQNCLVMLTEFLKKRRHIAITCDEYGGVSGLVSLEDILETMLGTEIVDENDSVVDLQKLARKQRQKRFDMVKTEAEASSATES